AVISLTTPVQLSAVTTIARGRRLEITMAQLPRMVLIPWQVETLKSVIGRQQDRIADIIERLVTASAATQHRGTCRRQILWGELSEGLARARERAEDDGMRSAVASLCVCWLAYCSAPRSNTAALA